MLSSLMRRNLRRESVMNITWTCFSFRRLSKKQMKIDENDVIEKFVKGTGPGGQSVNKTRNCVQLTHLPSGISVQCHQQRDLASNRRIARKILQDKIEYSEMGKNSKIGKRIEKKKKRKQKAARRAKEKYGSQSVIDNELVNEDSDANVEPTLARNQ